MPTTNPTPATEQLGSNFIQLTRMFKVENEVKEQKIILNAFSVESWRPANKVGSGDNRSRCTVRTVSGYEFHVKELFSTVTRKVADAA